MVKSDKRLAHLDALRGLAAFTVVFQHSIEAIWRQAPPTTAAWAITSFFIQTINLGRFGVILFFLISGFVIPFSLKTDLTTFATTRFFRLFPVFWLCIAIGLFVGPMPGSDPWTAKQIVINATMMQHFLHTQEMYGQFWSLSYEVLFYFACAALFLVNRLRSPTVIGAIAIILIALADVPDVSRMLTGTAWIRWRELPFFFPFLFLGTLLRLAVLENDKRAKLICWFAVPFALISAPVFGGAYAETPATNPFLSPAPVTAGFAVALIVFIAALYAKIHSRFLVRMGAISYSAYLFQTIAIILMLRLIQIEDTISAAGFLAATLILLVIVSSLLYNFVEVPAINMGRHITGLQRRSLATDVAP